MILGNAIYIDGDIGENEYGGGNTAANFAADVQKLNGQKQIDVHINSGGGSYFDGMAIVSHIQNAQQLGHKITCIVDGYAASAASAIAVAGSPCRMNVSSVLMIHAPWHPHAAGGVDDLKKAIKSMEVATETLIALYANRSGQSKKTIAAWLQEETWFTADEAKAAGLIDGIDYGMPALAACIHMDQWRLPARVEAAIRGPARRQMETLRRECQLVASAGCYEDARDARERACAAAKRLTTTPGSTDYDLSAVIELLDKMKSDWSIGEQFMWW